jgi:glycosyltransferase involved in cell wall biosynthesis
LPGLREVVLVYAPPWTSPTRFSKHHLASYLAARGARVLYVEAPLTPLGLHRWRSFASELRASLRPPRLVRQRLWVRRHFLPIPYHAVTTLTSSRMANRIGQRLIAPVLRRDLARLDFARPVLVAGLPHALDVVPYVPRKLLVYHCADDYAHVRGFPSSLSGLEGELCRRADLVIATSSSLCDARRPFNPNTHWIPNGVDFEHFSRAADPSPELGRFPKPIVGFVGGLSEWVDLELIAQLAQARPRWTFVMIGPVAIDTRPLLSAPNVHLLGPRAYASLPEYLAGMDVATIPFKRNPVTYHADPIKAYEYLASGVPVVATSLPALQRLAHVIRLADSAEEFLAQLDVVTATGRDAGFAERRAEGARHSWSARFRSFDDLVQTLLPCAC